MQTGLVGVFELSFLEIKNILPGNTGMPGHATLRSKHEVHSKIPENSMCLVTVHFVVKI